ncbi:MAG: PAS domain-containing protein [Planctomycetota bacterium]|jgi:PAS domain S-box-containing protein
MVSDEQKGKEQLLEELKALREQVKDLQKKSTFDPEAGKGLDDSEKKWYMLLENVPSIIMIADRRGVINYINHTVPGLTVEDAIGKSLYDFIEHEHHQIARETTEQVFRTGEQGRYEIRGVGPEGRTSWYETLLGPLKNGDRIEAVTLVCRDITDRKIAEEALRKSEAQLKALLDVPNDMIVLSDTDGVIEALNDSMAAFLGKSKEELIGVNGYDLFPENLAESKRKMHEKVITTAQPIYYEEKTQGRIFDVGVYPVMGSAGVEKLAIFVRDITERRQAEESLDYIRDKL